jgi:hypothetical protein
MRESVFGKKLGLGGNLSKKILSQAKVYFNKRQTHRKLELGPLDLFEGRGSRKLGFQSGQDRMENDRRKKVRVV